MAEIKIVGIKELKNSLSAYLRDVRRGTRILVSDRDTVVAEIHEPMATYDAGVPDPVVREWVRDGLVVPPSMKKAPLPVSPVHLEEGTAAALLERDREEGER